VAGITMAVCVMLGSITGYALARLNFKWGIYFLFAMIFSSTRRSKTVPVALADMIGKYSIRYGDMTAGAVIAALFPVVLALIFQKYLVKSLTAGGIKG